jgi:hypothetical protein
MFDGVPPDMETMLERVCDPDGVNEFMGFGTAIGITKRRVHTSSSLLPLRRGIQQRHCYLSSRLCYLAVENRSDKFNYIATLRVSGNKKAGPPVSMPGESAWNCSEPKVIM